MKNLERVPLVLLPGKLCTQRIWQNQMNSLKHLCDPIFIELSAYSTLEEILEAISNQAPDQFALAGFSMGGFIALEYVLREKNRVKKLALIGNSSRGYDSHATREHQIIIDMIQRFGFKGLAPKAIQQLIHPSRSQDSLLVETIQQMAIQLGSSVFLRQEVATLDRRDRRSQLPQISCPTLVVGGRDDQLVSVEEFLEIADAIPNAQLHLLEKCGHMVPLEYPELLTNFMQEWLKS